MDKKGIYMIFSLIVFSILIIPLISAGFSEWHKTITGKGTSQSVTVNISMVAGTAPNITAVFNGSSEINISGGLNEGPATTGITINFTVYEGDGYANINSTSAKVNVTKSGQETRSNSSCMQNSGAGGKYANYSCNVTIWWWDGNGEWTITAYIEDNDGNKTQNLSTKFQIGTTTGFNSNSILSWNQISPGAVNQTPSNNITINNTGNTAITTGNIKVNATNLLGEATSTLALYANNFSAHILTGNNAECNVTATTMSKGVDTGVTGAALAVGNYTLSNGTAQEYLYFCLRIIGGELSSQSYSTAGDGSWTVKITT